MLSTDVSDDFRLASDKIFDALTELSSNNASSQEIDLLLDRFVKGGEGREVQYALLEVCLALQRFTNATQIHLFLGYEATYLKSHIFRAVDRYGHPDGASHVLRERIAGTEGFVDLTKMEYMAIRANVSHLGGSADNEAARYWRLRVKAFKNRILSELRQYIHAAQISVDAATDTFNTSVSRSMNKVLEMKNVSEEYQGILIEHRANTLALSLPVISLLMASEVVKDHTFPDFLCESADESDAADFRHRLGAVTQRAPKLRVLEDVYAVLSEDAGIRWQGIEQAMHDFQKGMDAALEEYYKSIENMIDMLDYADLPDEFPAEELTQPFLEITEKVFGEIKIHSDKWLQLVMDQRQELWERLHPK